MKNILTIDDDHSLCLLLEKMLSEKYAVYSCNSAMDALCWLTEGNLPDVIITDVMMPSLTGIELLEKLKESALFKSIPVIILSGLDDPENRQKSLELGAHAFLLKPFSPESLLNAIDELMPEDENEPITNLNNNLYAQPN